MLDVRAALPIVLLASTLVAVPAAAQEQVAFVEPATYLSLFDDADLRGVQEVDDAVYEVFGAITGDVEVDRRIRALAESRGYLRRPVATGGLQQVGSFELQPAVAEAWTEMRGAAQLDGVSLALTSGHRSLAQQRSLFLRRLGGDTSDAGIERALRTSAPPGYSKHHGGHAIDVADGGTTEPGFINTRAYRWLSEFDFARAKQFGFVPSYPAGGDQMGPDPESWEFVWVGAGRIACEVDGALTAGFCDIAASPRVDDIVWLTEMGVTVGCAPGRYCPDDTLTRGEAASLLWRLYGAPEAEGTSPFVDVYPTDHFASAVDWLWSSGVVLGTSDATFSPDAFLETDDALRLLVRLAERVESPSSAEHGDITIGDLGLQIDRAEFATVLRATATS